MNVTGTVALVRLENRIIKATLSMLQNSVLCTKDEMNLNFRSTTNTVSFYSDGTFYENIPIANLTINGVAIADEATFDTQVGILFKDALEDDVEELVNALDVMTIATVDDFAPLEPKAAIKVIIVREVQRGGEFRRYDGAYADDQGIVFTDNLGQRWFRRIKDNWVDLLWFGAVYSELDGAPTGVDAEMAAAIAAANNTEVIAYPNLYIPSSRYDGGGLVYCFYLSFALTITTPMNIFSDAKKGALMFGIAVNGLTFDLSAAGSTLKNIVVRNFRDLIPKDLDLTIQDYRGITIQCKVEFENVEVLISEGDGYSVICNSGEGDARGSIFKNCLAYANGKHGFNVQGDQSHSITFIHCRAEYNGCVGFNDNTLIRGNTYIGCYTNGNGGSETLQSRCMVSYLGNIYLCIREFSTGNLPTNTGYWVKLDSFFAGDSYVLPYNAGNYYYKGGGFSIDLENLPQTSDNTRTQNQHSSLISCISENNQPPSYTSSQTVILGGLNQSNSDGDPYLFRRFFDNIGVANEASAGIKELEFTTSSAAQQIIARDFYLSRAVHYEVDILAIAPGFDIWRTKRIITITGKKDTNVTAIKENTETAVAYKDAGIITAAFGAIVNDATIGVYNCALYVTGIAGTTIHWKIHVRKQFSSPNF